MITPQKNDVIVGRGHTILNHPGNKHFHKIIKTLKPQYDEVPRYHKRLQAELVVNEIVTNLNPPGRFLKKNPTSGFYEEISKDVAVKKAWQALRDVKIVVRQWKEEQAGCDSLGYDAKNITPLATVTKNKASKSASGERCLEPLDHMNTSSNCKGFINDTFNKSKIGPALLARETSVEKLIRFFPNLQHRESGTHREYHGTRQSFSNIGRPASQHRLSRETSIQKVFRIFKEGNV